MNYEINDDTNRKKIVVIYDFKQHQLAAVIVHNGFCNKDRNGLNQVKV